MFVSETYVIEDCLFYDSATSDKTSKYSTLNADSFTHTTDCYSLVRALGESSASKYYTPVYLTDFTLPSDYEISVDISTDTISQEMLNIVSSPVQTYQGVSEFGVLSTAVRYGLFKRVSGTGTFYTTNGSLNANEFYTFKVRVNGTSVTGTITDSNGVQKHTNTQSISQASDFHKFTIVNGGKAHTVKFKNVKVKPL